MPIIDLNRFCGLSRPLLERYVAFEYGTDSRRFKLNFRSDSPKRISKGSGPKVRQRFRERNLKKRRQEPLKFADSRAVLHPGWLTRPLCHDEVVKQKTSLLAK
jgi:hypothetical protein